MALTPEQVTSLLSSLHDANVTAASNAAAVQRQQQLQMDSMQKLMEETLNRHSAAEERAVQKSQEVKVEKKGEKELDTRSFARVEKFDGGELTWAEGGVDERHRSHDHWFELGLR